MINIRMQSSSTIHYFLITKPSNQTYRDFITIPLEFESSILNLLPLLPIDVFQVINPSAYYQLKRQEIEETCLSFNVIYESTFELSRLINDIGQNLMVFIIDQIIDLNGFLEKVSGKKNIYFCFLKDQNRKVDFVAEYQNFFTEGFELVQHIKRDVESLYIANPLFLEVVKSLTTISESNKLNTIPFFKAAHTNFFIECQINGNYWTYKDAIDTYDPDFLEQKRKEVLSKEKINSDDRLDIFIEQFLKMDKKYLDNFYPIKVTDIDYDFNPLILTFPFINPQSQKLSIMYGVESPEVITRLLKTEQNRNYIFNKEVKDEDRNFMKAHMLAVAQIIYPRLNYLDFIRYLHSTFRFSPSIRFPMIANSILSELSFLKPDSKNLKTQKSLNKTITKFGKRLSNLTLTKRIQDYIQKRSCQIVAISDLPIEWLQINDIPLAITHDVCRIPETNLKMPMALFALNQNFNYLIPKNLSDKTLVIFGCSINEYEYNISTEVAIRECIRLNINYKRCLGVTDFISTVKNLKPDLLILDCHGQYDSETLSSYLIINGEKLSHEEIVSIDFPIPLIFLSSCATSPNYGYVHSIANAFFSNGSFSVTSTYLPIDVVNGTITYLRLLWHLDTTSRNGDFPNWLSYISFVTRISLFNKIVEKLPLFISGTTSSKRNSLPHIIKEIERIKDLMIAFPNRRSTFEKLNDLLNNINSEFRINMSSLMSENLLYTHLGRSDLIQFESWRERKLKSK